MWRSLNLGFFVSPVVKIHFMGFKKKFELHTGSLSTLIHVYIQRLYVYAYMCIYARIYACKSFCGLKHSTRRKETHREGGDRER